MIVSAIALLPSTAATGQSLAFREMVSRIENPPAIKVPDFEFRNPTPFDAEIPCQLSFAQNNPDATARSRRDFTGSIDRLQPPLPEFPAAPAVPVSHYLPDPYGYSSFSTTGVSLGGGAFIAAIASTESLPGLMGIERGTLLIGQRIGNVTISAAATAQKMGWYRGLNTSYMFSANLDWEINSTFSMHFFGSYRPGGYRWFYNSPTTTPAMMGYMSTSGFGGYMSINLSNRFGVDVGAQAYYNMATGRYEAQPIVAPYYRVNKDVKIGLDVGGIVYNLLKSSSGNRENINPTIRPPFGQGSTPPPRVQHR